MKRIKTLLQSPKDRLKVIYYTAGFPNLTDTRPILKHLQNAGADMVEIGIPFSDPIADGETIQKSNQKALANGMNLLLLLEQLQDMRNEIHIPVLLMGYFNPILQFGVEAFCQKCAEVGIDGLILPDMPLYEYEKYYQALFEQYDLSPVFLVTPQTPPERLRIIDNLSKTFIYAVSSATTTGKNLHFGEAQLAYFESLQKAQLQHPHLIGFGISQKTTFEQACRYAKGAIIGSAFIQMIAQSKDYATDINVFMQQFQN